MKWQFLSSFFLFVSLSSLQAGLEAESLSWLPYFLSSMHTHTHTHTHTLTHLFSYFWLHHVGSSSQRVACRAPGLPSCGMQAQLLQHMDLAALWQVESEFPNQGLNSLPLHWKVDS